MLNKTVFKLMTNLQQKAASLTSQPKASESDEKRRQMEKHYESCLAAKDREIKKLERELAEAHAGYDEFRHKWLEVIADMEKEHAKALKQKDREIDSLNRKVQAAYSTIESQKEKLLAQKKELYKVQTELEDEKGKVLKLKAQINRDHENSGIPSSQIPNRKKITNNREKTGRAPGGQKGHKGHARKKHTPARTIEIQPPEEFLHTDKYKETGRIITKQLVNIRVCLDVTEFTTPEFRDLSTGQRVHAPFPEGLINEVTYGGSVKAFAFLLNNRCNVSILKTSDFLREITRGELQLSAGMINGLSKEFSKKTQAERKQAFSDLLLSPAIYTDFTTAKVNGKNMAVLVCANDNHVIYFAREHKGHKGVEGTPVETYLGSLIHDHDITFFSYGKKEKHQGCLEHVRRYLKDSMANEPNLTWNRKMHPLVKEMMAWWGGLDPNDERNPDLIDPEAVSGFESRYDEILKLAGNEYEYEPPNKYYRDGYNLFKRLRDYRDSYLLFLHDKDVSPTNNLSERLLRIFKRKQQQVMSFRSFEGLDFLCQSLGVFASTVNLGNNLYDRVSDIFSKGIDSLSFN